MHDLIDYIVKSLVTNPEAVQIQQTEEDGAQIFILSVAPEDMGIVIGKSGQTIKSIRKLMAVRAMADGSRVYLRLNDPGANQAEPEADNETEVEAGTEAEPKSETENDTEAETKTEAESKSAK